MGLYGRVKDVCADKGMNILLLEDTLGFPRSSICKWDENIPSVAKVKKVADALGVSINVLTDGVDFPEKRKK